MFGAVKYGILQKKGATLLELNHLDPYVLWVLQKHGWTPERVFSEADAWIERMERLGHSSFDYGERVLHSLGGMRFREYYPYSYQKLVQSWQNQGLPPARWPEAAEIRDSCQAALAALRNLGLEPEHYKGAAFTFNALDAALDEEIVLDLDLAREVTGKPLFPIGTVEPDGLVYTAPDHSVYVLFCDSIFYSGSCVEEFLHILFIRGHRPQKIYSINEQESAQ